MREAVETWTEDGWRLRGELLWPAGEPVGAVALGHAMWVDRRTLDRPRGGGLASTLAGQGLAVLCFDLRGHGQSGPSAAEGAVYTYDDFVQRDVPAIVAAARARFPALGVTLVGHSLTGHAGMIAAGLLPDRAPDAIVGLAANMWVRRFDRGIARRAAKTAALLGWVGVTAPFGRFDARRLRVGTDPEPWAYVAHYLRMYRRGRLESADGRIDYLAAMARARVPVLSVTSEGDRWMARPDETRRFVDTMRDAPITHRVVTRADVDPPPGHAGLVMHPSCKPIWREVAGWIRERAVT